MTTRQIVLDCVTSWPGIGLTELADEVPVVRSCIHKHLVRLVAEGRLRRERIQRTGRGNPWRHGYYMAGT